MSLRVTTRMMSDLGVARMNDRLAQFERSQRNLATGRRIHVASDDVAGMNQSLSVREGIASAKQAQRNAHDGISWIQIAETRLSGATDQLQRVNELLIEANNATTNQAGRNAISSELSAIKESLVGIANSKHRGRFVFGGYSATPPVVDSGGWSYAGDNGEVRRRVADGENVVVNVTADNAFGFTAGDDLFTMLDTVVADLQAGSTASVPGSITSAQGALDRILDARAELGSAVNRIEQAEFRSRADELDMRTQLSSVEDTDMAEAIMELQIQETAYQAAQNALAKTIQPSLAQFLR